MDEDGVGPCLRSCKGIVFKKMERRLNKGKSLESSSILNIKRVNVLREKELTFLLYIFV